MKENGGKEGSKDDEIPGQQLIIYNAFMQGCPVIYELEDNVFNSINFLVPHLFLREGLILKIFRLLIVKYIF